MKKKETSYNKQFKRGAFPDEHWDESTRVNGHTAIPPSKMRKRDSIALGNQSEARPGMVGKQDYVRKRKK